MAEYNKICPVCGIEFVAKRKDHTYCSYRCYDMYIYWSNPIQAREKSKKYRTKDAYKRQNKTRYDKNPQYVIDRITKWRLDNPNKHKENRKRYKYRVINELRDNYIRELISRSSDIERHLISDEMIELKRTEIQLIRAARKINQTIKDYETTKH